MGIFNKILKNEYGRHLLTLFSGTGVAQLVPIIFYPIISRLFLPENFGTLATINQIASISAVVASCKYEMAILLCKDKKEAINLVFLIITQSISVLSILFSLFYIFIGFFSKLLHDNSLHQLSIIPFLSALFIIIYQVYNEWCVREKNFTNLSINKVINSSSVSISQFLAGILKGFQNSSLVLGDMIGRMVSAISCSLAFLHKEKNLLKEISFPYMKKCALDYRDCPKYLLPGQLLNTIGQALPVFMLGGYFSQQDVGFFSMAFMVVVIPSSVLSLAFRDVFRQKAISLINVGLECRQLFISNFKILCLLSFIIFGLLYIISPWLFSYVLGQEWITSGVLARILIPMVAVSFITESLSAMMIVRNKMNYQFYWQISYLLLTFISLLVGSYSNTISGTLISFSIGRIISYIISFIICFRLSSSPCTN